MEVNENNYLFKFSTKDVEKFNKIFAQYLRGLSDNHSIPTFKMGCSKEQVTVFLPSDTLSFSFIAQIIEQIDTFGINCVSHPKEYEPKKRIEEENSPYVNVDKKVLSKLGNEKEIEEVPIKQPKKVLDENTKKMTNKLKDFMHTESSYNLADLKKEFPTISEKTIRDMLYRENKLQRIYRIGVGQYSAINPKIKQINKKDKIINRLKEYVLKQKKFSMKELTLKFPDIYYDTIANIIYKFKCMGMVENIGNGEYLVKKVS